MRRRPGLFLLEIVVATERDGVAEVQQREGVIGSGAAGVLLGAFETDDLSEFGDEAEVFVQTVGDARLDVEAEQASFVVMGVAVIVGVVVDHHISELGIAEEGHVAEMEEGVTEVRRERKRAEGLLDIVRGIGRIGVISLRPHKKKARQNVPLRMFSQRNGCYHRYKFESNSQQPADDLTQLAALGALATGESPSL